LVAPDDSARVQWIVTLVETAQGLLDTLPIATANPNSPSSGPIERWTILPVPGEFEANSEQSHRLQRIGRLGRTVCERPRTAPAPTPEVAALLDEARLFLDYLSRDYTAALNSLDKLEARAETPESRLRLLSLRAQIFLAKGDVDRTDHTIQYLESCVRKPPRQIEWTGSGYVLTEPEPEGRRGWPSYLAWRSSAVRAQLFQDAAEDHVNPDAPRPNFDLGPLPPRGNMNFPNDPFLNNPNDLRVVPNRDLPVVKPRMPMREPPEGAPRL
jgi:hypothetical protein